MWRFTPQSLDYLFPHVAFDPERCAISTRSPDARFPIDEAPELGLGSSLREQSAPMRFAIKALRRLKLDRGLFRERALLLESNLMMIGTRKDEPTYRFFPEQYLPDEASAS